MNYYHFINFLNYNINQFGGNNKTFSNNELINAIRTRQISKKYGDKISKVYERWLLSKFNNFDDIDNVFISEMKSILNIPTNKAIEILNDIKNFKINLKNMILNDTDKIIQIKTDIDIIEISKTKRIRYLIDNFGFDKMMNSCLRYISITPYIGQQLAMPQEHYDLLYEKYNVRHEGFASPFNSKLIEKKDCTYCSLFYDTDKYLNSLGSFFDVKLNELEGNWVINPPFVEDIINKMADHVLKYIPKAIYIMISNWQDNEGIKKLLKVCKGYKVFKYPIFENSTTFETSLNKVNAHFPILYIALGKDAQIEVLDKYPHWKE